MKSYLITNKSLIKVLNELERLQNLVLKFNENHNEREYSINIIKDISNKFWNAEMKINYERAEKNRALEKVN